MAQKMLPSTDQKWIVGISVSAGFRLTDLALILDGCQLANEYLHKTAFDVSVLGRAAGPVLSSTGVSLPVADIGSFPLMRNSVLVVLSGAEGARRGDFRTESVARAVFRHGGSIWAIGLGAFVVANAGVLAGSRCTTHWLHQQSFAERFPEVTLANELVIRSGNIFSCAGGESIVDLLADFLASSHGPAAADFVADIFLHGASRDLKARQRNKLIDNYDVPSLALRKAVHLMEANCEQPISRPDLAKAVGISVRQLERLFRRYLNVTPGQFDVILRLQKGRQLLRLTNLPISEISASCGFGSQSHFTRRYRCHFGTTPRSDRRPWLAKPRAILGLGNGEARPASPTYN